MEYLILDLLAMPNKSPGVIIDIAQYHYFLGMSLYPVIQPFLESPTATGTNVDNDIIFSITDQVSFLLSQQNK